MMTYCSLNVCIACLSSEDQKFVLFNQDLKNMYLLCTNLQVQDNESTPQGLCYDCSQTVNNFFNFRERCINNYKFLKEQDITEPVNICKKDPLSNSRRQLNDFLEDKSLKKIITITKIKTRRENKLSRKYPLECLICSFQFKSREHHETHMREHVGKKPVICKVCGKSYNKWHGLLQHMVIHNGEKKFVCHCGKSFYYKGSYKVHLKTHGSEEVKTFICDECGKGFRTNAELKHHKFSHITATPLKCEDCSKSFKNNQCLRAHIQRHSKIKNHTCLTCGKSTVTKAELRIHMRTHTNLKPFKCELCAKDFRVRSALHSHRLSHTGFRKYKCEKCTKLFMTSGSLKRHMTVHTQEKSQKCDVCDKSFSQKSSLKTHLKKHILLNDQNNSTKADDL